MRKERFVVCLMALSLSSPVVVHAQTNPTANPVSEQTDNSRVDNQQASKDATASDAGTSLDTASRAPDVASAPGTNAGKTRIPAATAPGSAAVGGYTFPSGSELKRYWLRNVIGFRAAAGATFTASWKTWVDTTPTEWHRDAEGWSKRLGTAFLDNSINQSSLVILSRAMGQDPMYYRCACTGFWPRTKHAFKMGFVGRNHNGDAVFSPAKIVSPFTGPLVTRSTIYPDRFGPSDAFSGAAGPYYLLGSIGWNWIREFIGKSPRW